MRIKITIIDMSWLISVKDTLVNINRFFLSHYELK